MFAFTVNYKGTPLYPLPGVPIDCTHSDVDQILVGTRWIQSGVDDDPDRGLLPCMHEQDTYSVQGPPPMLDP